MKEIADREHFRQKVFREFARPVPIIVEFKRGEIALTLMV